MNIATYLQQYGYRAAAVLAQRAGTRLIYLKQIAWGLRRPSAELALRMEHASGGLLAAYELRPDLPWPHAPRPLPAAVPAAVPAGRPGRPAEPFSESGASPVATATQAAGAFSLAGPPREPEPTPS